MILNSPSPGVSYTMFYILMLFLSLLFGAFSDMDKKRKKWYIFIIFFIFFIVMAFKNLNMGNDTKNYATYFELISSYKSPNAYIAKSDLEAGYIWLNWLTAKYFGEVRALFIIYAAFINISIGRFVYKYVDTPGVFVCLFLGLTQFDFFLNAQRQAITIAIFLFAFDCLVQKKKLKYIILCVTATLFHYTAIIMLLIYPLISSNKIENTNTHNSKTMFLLFGVIIFATLFLDKLYAVIISFYPRYAYYANSEYIDRQPRLAVLLKTIVYVLLLLIPKLFRSGSNTYIYNHNKGERLSMINIAVMIVSIGATAFMRFSPVFNLYANMHFSNTANNLNRVDKTLIISLTILLSFLFGLTVTVLKTPEWQTTYPIKLDI